MHAAVFSSDMPVAHGEQEGASVATLRHTSPSEGLGKHMTSSWVSGT